MGLPAYDSQLSAFHQAFEAELRALVNGLPLTPGMRVLDLACGDGFYTRRLSERLGPAGRVTGADIDPAYLTKAGAASSGHPNVDYVRAAFDHLPFREGTFDLVWCAQSLYSLPDPVEVIAHLAHVLRPGGVVAVLENDTLHQVLLPWPASLELPLRSAELRCFQEGDRPSRFYVGRRLPAVLADAGLEPLQMSTHAFDRQAPLGEAEQRLLQSYLEEVEERVTPHLEAAPLEALRRLVGPESPEHLLRLPHLSLTWVSVLALGRKP